jgi:hypothetical protein
MASTSSTYILPGPSSTILGSKSILIRQSPTAMLHQHIVKSIPSNETFHSLPPKNHHDDNNLSHSMESINNIGLIDDEVR